jgi:hypothetical protein
MILQLIFIFLHSVENNFNSTILKPHEEFKTLWGNNSNKERTFALQIMKGEKRKQNNKRKQVTYKQRLQKGKSKGL